MIVLSDYKDQMNQFVVSSLSKFTSEHYRPYVIGAYSCPAYGWTTLNFNITHDAPFDNCPDFEFVEYDLISFEDWENSLSEGDSEWQNIDGNVIKLKWDDGNEVLNELIFNFLKSIVLELKQTKSLPLTFVQMLDSKYCELIK